MCCVVCSDMLQCQLVHYVLVTASVGCMGIVTLSHHCCAHSDQELARVARMASLLCMTAATNGWMALLHVVLPAMQLAQNYETDKDSSHAASTWLEECEDREDDACCSVATGSALEGIHATNLRPKHVQEVAPLLWDPAVPEPVVGMGVLTMVLVCLAAMATTEPASSF